MPIRSDRCRLVITQVLLPTSTTLVAITAFELLKHFRWVRLAGGAHSFSIWHLISILFTTMLVLVAGSVALWHCERIRAHWAAEITRQIESENGCSKAQSNVTDFLETEVERERLHATITRAAAEWRLTFDAVESPILMMDLSGRVRRLNRSARDLLGKARFQEVLGHAICEFSTEEPWKTIERMVAELSATRVPATRQTTDADQGKTWNIDATFAIGAHPTQDSAIVIARDVTDLIALQTSVRRSETMAAMGALVAGVAHEVRNPLFSISATVDTFEACFGDREEFREYLSMLRREVDRLRELMQDLLEYGKPLNVSLTSGSLEPVLARAVQSCKLLAQERQVPVLSRIKEDIPEISMDASRLSVLFKNLLENAIQHSPPSANVVLEAYPVQANGRANVECVVRDAGSGFQPDDLRHIFAPFFSRRRGGTGLGLSIVHRIIDEHKGSISVSNAPSGGAVITVRFPVNGQ